jgi:hypothetical protein
MCNFRHDLQQSVPAWLRQDSDGSPRRSAKVGKPAFGQRQSRETIEVKHECLLPPKTGRLLCVEYDHTRWHTVGGPRLGGRIGHDRPPLSGCVAIQTQNVAHMSRARSAWLFISRKARPNERAIGDQRSLSVRVSRRPAVRARIAEWHFATRSARRFRQGRVLPLPVSHRSVRGRRRCATDGPRPGTDGRTSVRVAAVRTLPALPCRQYRCLVRVRPLPCGWHLRFVTACSSAGRASLSHGRA